MKQPPMIIRLAPLLILISCADTTSVHQHETMSASEPEVQITLGNGDLNRIELDRLSRVGPSLTVASVTAHRDSFLVLHPFENGSAVQTDYVGSTFIRAGQTDNLHVRLDDSPNAGDRFIIMLHTDVNEDGRFQFGDGVTVADAPLFEGSTLIALPIQAPPSRSVTPDIIRASAGEHAQKAAAFAERADYRDNAETARARALAHQWLATVESDKRSLQAALNVLTPEFIIDFPSGPLKTTDELEAWLSGPATSFEATRHVLHDVEVTPNADGTIAMGMEMEWDGLLPGGGRMSARTRHDWIIRNQDGEFRIAQMTAQILEPFRPTDWT